MTTETGSQSVDLSVVVPTFNRAGCLPSLVWALLSQRAPGLRFEIIVVDNGSTDRTPAVLETLAAAHPTLVCVHEPRAGASHARNAGVARARGAIIAFIDDDVLPANDWLAQIDAAFRAHPDVDCLGGRVEPLWTVRPPRWLTPAHYAPLALQFGRGDARPLDAANASSCLVTANFACRRAVFDEVGGFAPEFMRDEDREFNLRLWRAGKRGLYADQVRTATIVPPERLTKRYHRRWYAVTGRNHARLRYREIVDRDGRLVDPPNGRTVLGVPGYLCRELLVTTRAWMAHLLRRREEDAFRAECHLRYLVSYIGGIAARRGRRPAEHASC